MVAAALAATTLCLTGPLAAAPSVAADGGTPKPGPTDNGADTTPPRRWTVSGRPVTSGTTRDEAPVLQPGRYTETLAADSTVRYYRLPRSRGATVHFSVAGRDGSGRAPTDSESFDLTLGLADGTECATTSTSRYDSDHAHPALIDAVVLDGSPVARTGVLSDECRRATTLIASVQRDAGGGHPMPSEIVYLEEPPIRTGRLPDAAKGRVLDAFRAPASSRTTPVRGSGSFSGAPTLTTGSYRDSVQIGEQVFYRVRLAFGQRAAFTVEVPRNGSGFRAVQTYNVSVDTYGPDRSQVSSAGGDLSTTATVYEGTDPETIGQFTAPVRYLNRDDPDADLRRDLGPAQVEDTALAGYFTFGILVGTPGGDIRPGGVPALPMRISVQVKGTATSGPRYEGRQVVAPGLPPDATSEQSEGPDTLLLVGVGSGVVLIVLLGAAGWAVRRRTRRSRRAHTG